ncbi:hypothetical protein [Polyangium sp. y55x31]|uniref:hypothetical protein n=1 Tax=Polyangium sp. y55x31 TaxID=3042688 RepID=UPI002482AF7B|nr:hypothetical protein [Polyangium sp. y55x31]MDI1480743.1 hypothetical protein [Polyangium sp. y55x31]
MNQFSKFFALLGLSASVALVGAGCAAEVEDPASELALTDEANDSAELAVSVDETTAESEDALSTNGGCFGGGCGIGAPGFSYGYDYGCRGYDCLIGGRHFLRGPYYGPLGGYGRGYYGYGHAGWAYAHGRIR